MTDRKHIEAFNHHLDALLSGDEIDPNALSDADRQALDIANRLSGIDLSTQSQQRYDLRRKFFPHRLGKLTSSVEIRSLQPSAALGIALPSATLLFVLVFVLGWTFVNLSRLSSSNQLVAATAFTIPGATIDSSLPPSANRPAVQAFVPQPLPTPIAPQQLTAHTSSTAGPDQTLLQTSQRADPLGVTRSSP